MYWNAFLSFLEFQRYCALFNHVMCVQTTLVSGELVTSTKNGGTQEGKKKTTVTSLNHLLNFTIAPTERRSVVVVFCAQLTPFFNAAPLIKDIVYTCTKTSLLRIKVQGSPKIKNFPIVLMHLFSR